MFQKFLSFCVLQLNNVLHTGSEQQEHHHHHGRYQQEHSAHVSAASVTGPGVVLVTSNPSVYLLSIYDMTLHYRQYRPIPPLTVAAFRVSYRHSSSNMNICSDKNASSQKFGLNVIISSPFS